MRKILIIGCPGSGKSTFARKLSIKTGIPLFYLDMLWHKSDKTTVTRDEFDIKLKEILKLDFWIIDGNYSRTLEARLKSADTVFLFDLPTELCIDGVKSRIGAKRDDMPWIETELDVDFKVYIENFATQQLPQIKDLLGKYSKDKTIISFCGREEADMYISEV